MDPNTERTITPVSECNTALKKIPGKKPSYADVKIQILLRKKHFKEMTIVVP